jgi:hypothetical protein
LASSSWKGMKEIKIEQTVYSVQQLESMMKSEKDKREMIFTLTKEKENLKNKLISFEKLLFVAENKCANMTNSMILLEKELKVERENSQQHHQMQVIEEAEEKKDIHEKALLLKEIAVLKEQITVFETRIEEQKESIRHNYENMIAEIK